MCISIPDHPKCRLNADGATHLVRVHTVLDGPLDVVRYVVRAGPDDHCRYAIASCFIPHNCDLGKEPKIPSLPPSLHANQAGGIEVAIYCRELWLRFDSETLTKGEKQPQKKR